MKVACIGNMNNNFFSLVRFLRDAGVDAELLVMNYEQDHFHPSNDTFSRDYLQYTRRIGWGDPFKINNVSGAAVAESLRPYDFLIACGTSPAFIHKSGRKVDMFIPHGGDLREGPYFDWKLRNPVKLPHHVEYFMRQRRGIREAGYISATNFENEKLNHVSRLGFRGELLKIEVPMIYTPLYNPETIRGYHDCSHWNHEYRKVREQHDLVIFHHARHVWNNPENSFWAKGNDRLIRGFAEFSRGWKDGRPALITLEYGDDVQASKKLISELGIEDQVFWFPKMSRKDIMVGISMADIGGCEFTWGWLGSGTIYENLALAKPALFYREDKLYRNLYPELYPVMNVHTSDDIREALKDYVTRPDHYKEMGEKGRQWLQKYVVDKPIAKYLEIIGGGSRVKSSPSLQSAG